MSKITIREVAHEASVGIGTVSRVLNNSPHVSDATRERVMQVIDKLGFKPNSVARQLPRKANFKTIAIMTLPFYEYYSFVERLQGVQSTLNQYGDEYELTLYNTNSLKDYDKRFKTIVERSVMAGMLIIDLDLTKEQKTLLRNMNIPFVGLNHHEATDWICIGTDNVHGGYLAGKHLIDLGHRNIAYVGNQFIDSAGFKTSGQRFEGLQKALHEGDLTIPHEYIKLGILTYDDARRLTHELLQLENPPTAIFAMSDTQAMGCITAIREADLRVPEDISVIGYDDIEIAHRIGLSTVRQHLKLSGKVAIEYLLQILETQAYRTAPELPELEVIHRLTTAHKS